MSPSPLDGDAVAGRARDWHHGLQALVCDVVKRWAHGTIMRATRYPSYWDFNLVRVEEDPAMSVDDLVAFTDQALAGLEHRRIDFDLAGAAEPLRASFGELGWLSERLVSMRHESPPPPGPGIQVEEVPYDAVRDLRAAWHEEDFPGVELGSYPEHAREVAALRRAQVLAVREGDTPVAFAQLERDGSAAEITQVYVHPDHRGQGRGTAMTRAAIEAAGDTRDLWIVADDEDRPKDLYARLGFRPVWRMTQFLRLPLTG